jgi:rod shape-determining protein MreB
MGLTSKKVAIDLGTASTRIHVPKKGIVVQEPTTIALDDEDNPSSPIAVGYAAHEMHGKSPDDIAVLRPMKAGVIANYGATKAMLSRFINRATGRFHISKPEAMITISGTATSTEKKALLDATLESGLQNVHMIQSHVAAALGAGLQIAEPNGVMIVDIGAGTTEVGVFSLGGVVSEAAIRTGGDNIDDAIRVMARREYGIRVSSDELFRIKSKFLNLKAKENNSINITGQNVIQGTPKKVTIKQKQLQSYVDVPIDAIVRVLKKVLEQTPPDVISDIAKHGAVLCGGSAQIRGLNEYLGKQLNIAFIKAQHPELAAIKGANLALTHLEEYRKSLLA